MSILDGSAIDKFFRSGLKLVHLRVLVSLAELRQITRVAAVFHVTQPAISKQIGEIEEALGVQLTRRVGNAVELTSVGLVLAARGQEILRQIELARRDVSALAAGTAGHVRFGTVSTVPEPLATKAVRLFILRAPHASLSVSEATLDRLLHMLNAGELDLVIGRSRIADDPTLVSETLQREPFVFVVGSAHALGLPDVPVTWESLQGLRWITPLHGSPAFATLAETLREQSVPLDGVSVESSSLLMNLSLLEGGEFISILPISVARHHVTRGTMRVLPLPPLELLGEVVLYWRADKIAPAAELFRECLREVAADLA